jgi:hypothetical protein
VVCTDNLIQNVLFGYIYSRLILYRYKYLSGLHHLMRGNESQARSKWKSGTSLGDKCGMALWSTLCQHQLERTDPHHYLNVEAYEAVGKKFANLGFPHLEKAVNDEIASFKPQGEQWASIQREINTLNKQQRLESNPSFQYSKRASTTPRNRRRNSVLRDGEFGKIFPT